MQRGKEHPLPHRVRLSEETVMNGMDEANPVSISSIESTVSILKKTQPRRNAMSEPLIPRHGGFTERLYRVRTKKRDGKR